MPFDGAFTHVMASELSCCVDCHIDKIYQPSRDELVFLLRKKDFAERMLISARVGAARVQLTEQKFENPETPPAFCMLARKYFSGAKLTAVIQPGIERILELHFGAIDEMGDYTALKIVCEFIGNQTNIVLISQNGRIIDAIHRSELESGKRLLLPGAVYEYPEPQQKINPISVSAEVLVHKINEFPEFPVSKAVLASVDGISPFTAREIAFRTGGDSFVCDSDTEKLKEALNEIIYAISVNPQPVMLVRNGIPADYSYIGILQYGAVELKQYSSFSILLDAFYSEKETAARMKKASADIERTVSRAYQRAIKRLALRREELRQCSERDKYRIYGELIKANLYSIASGAVEAKVCNYYDPELQEIAIPLDPALSPAANAAKYFKEYKKFCIAEQTLTALTASDEQEIAYLEAVNESLSRCENTADLEEIRTELYESGYMRLSSKNFRKKNKIPVLREYISGDGYKILVGRNNRQNDLLTTRIAEKNDLWFHTKNIPGSHVVICCGGKAVSEETKLAAAKLAAFYSKASDSEKVPVDYTYVKFIKKPNGAKPGMVIYTTNSTVFVHPENLFVIEETGK